MGFPFQSLPPWQGHPQHIKGCSSISSRVVPAALPHTKGSGGRILVVNKGLFCSGFEPGWGEREDRWVLGGRPMNVRDSAVTYGGYSTPQERQLSGPGGGTRPSEGTQGQQCPWAGDSPEMGCLEPCWEGAGGCKPDPIILSPWWAHSCWGSSSPCG